MYTQLFFDDQKLLLRENLKREYGCPVLIGESVYRDPVTEVASGVPCVLRAPDGTYHMIYFGTPADDRPQNTENLQPGAYVLAAVSTDGVRFTPRNTAREAGIENPAYENQVIAYFEGEYAGAFDDETCPDPAQRYKLLICEHDNENCHVMCKMFVSGDCIHWRIKPETVWDSYGSECGSVCRNPLTEDYVISTRPDAGDRRIAISHTRDWIHFTPEHTVLQCDALDPRLCEVYFMNPFFYKNMFIGFLWKYNTVPSAHQTKFQEGTVSVELAYSFDGDHWLRCLRDPFLGRLEHYPRGEKAPHTAPGSEFGMCAPGCVQFDENGDILIWCETAEGEHGYCFREYGKSAIAAFRLRKDGFIALTTETADTPAVLCTRDNRWVSGELSVNLSCENATVALYNRENTVIDGYDHSDCIPFSGDSTGWIPAWKGGKTLSALKDQIVQIELRMKNGTLYSFTGDYEPMMDLQSHRWKYLHYDSYRKEF